MRIMPYLLLSAVSGVWSFPGAVRWFSHSHSRTLYMRRAKEGSEKSKFAALYRPSTENQRKYWRCLEDRSVPIVVGVGPAGTGKTLLACAAAVQMLQSGEIHKIVLTRPMVSVEEELGFLPGSLVAKMDPWTRPIMDVLEEYYPKKEVETMIHNGVIEVSPLAYMRGRTFKRAFIIADEMQNSSPSQMLMMATRLGVGSKLVITGDLKQSDRMVENGLLDLTRRLNGHVGTVRCVELSTQDVMRSEVVQEILDLYEGPAVKVAPLTAPLIDSLTAPLTSDSLTVVPLTVDPLTVDPLTSDSLTAPLTVDPLTESDAKSDATMFEFISNDDAALIPRHHVRRGFPEYRIITDTDKSEQ